MHIHINKTFFQRDDFHVHLTYHGEPFSFVIRKMPSIDEPYWAITFFHEFDAPCPFCHKEGFYDDINLRYTNLSLPCLYFEGIYIEFLEEIANLIRLPFLMKHQIDIQEVILSMKQRKIRFQLKK